MNQQQVPLLWNDPIGFELNQPVSYNLGEMRASRRLEVIRWF